MSFLTYESMHKLYKESYTWKFDLLYFILKHDINIHTPFYITQTPQGKCLFQTLDLVIHHNGDFFEMNIISWIIHDLHDFILCT